MESAGINIALQLGRTAVHSQVNNHGVDMRKDGGKNKKEMSKLRVNGPRKTRVLRTLSHSQLMDQSKHDCSCRESTYVAKTEVSFKKNCLGASAQLEFLAGVKAFVVENKRIRKGEGGGRCVNVSYQFHLMQFVS